MSVTRGRPRAVTVAEARFFLSCGESIPQIARALGITVDSLARAAVVAGDARDVLDAINAYKLNAFEALGRAA